MLVQSQVLRPHFLQVFLFPRSGGRTVHLGTLRGSARLALIEACFDTILTLLRYHVDLQSTPIRHESGVEPTEFDVDLTTPSMTQHKLDDEKQARGALQRDPGGFIAQSRR